MKTSKKWIIAAVVALSASLAVMDNTIVTVILSQLQKAFQTDFETINWVTTTYLLAQAAVIPIVGYLSDRLGSKLVFLTSLALFVAASALCALAPTKEALFAFRVLQGIGGGALMPLAYAIIYRIFPPNERSTVTSVLSIPILLAPAFGPTLGGYLSTNFDWSAVFLINVPIGIVALLLAFLVLPQRKVDGSGDPAQSPQTKGDRKPFDMLGLLLAIVGFTALVYSISQAGSQGWGDQIELTFLLIGVAVLVAFVVIELRVSDPVLDLRLFMNYTFTISNILRWMVIGVFYGGLFLLPLFFENVQGNTTLATGEFLLGQGLMIGVGMTMAGLLYNRVGPRILTVFGLLLLVGSTYQLAQVDVNTTGQSLQFSLLLRGLGVGIVNQPLQTLAHSVVSNKGMAKASSLVNATRQVATATAVAALATYLTVQTATHTTDISNALQTGLQTHHLTGVAATCAQTAGSTQNLTTLTACVGQHALATSMADTFWIILILSAVCIPLGLVMGRDPAIEAYKRAKQASASKEEVQLTSKPNVISHLSANGGETMGSETLVRRYYEDNIVNGSRLKVESNQFCVLKLYGQVLNVYDAGQYILQDPHSSLFGSIQLAFSGEPIPWEYEVLYINRAKLIGKATGVVLSPEMTEVDYHVDYTISVATCEDAIQLVKHMPYSGHTLSIQEVSAHAGPIIEEAMNQLVRIIPLGPVGLGLAPDQGLQMTQDTSQIVHQRLQQFLSGYGITLDMVKVQGLDPVTSA